MFPNQFMPANSYNPYQRMANGITWVQGIEGAKAFQLMPSSNIVLMDSENDGVFYIKIADNVGMCSLRTFSYKEITDAPSQTYVTHDEFLKAINDLREVIDNGKQSV